MNPETIQLLEQGQVIITPSESSYGLTCDATNQEAINKIHDIKQEPHDKPLIIAVSNLNQLKQLGAIINKTIIKLSKALHPGQLNLIIPTTNNKTIAFRIPKNKILFEIAKQLNKPITTTSANIHTQHPMYNIQEVRQQFQDKVPLIIDTGNLDENTPASTIYDTINNKILRQGSITQEQIQQALR